MEERRIARVGTVSGLALLAGGTAVAAVAGGTHSVFATLLLGLLTLGLGHSLVVEIRRQARRMSPGWSRHDTVNAVLLGTWAEAALIMTIIEARPGLDRAVGLALALGYAAGCGLFVTERRRAMRVKHSVEAKAHPEVPAEATHAEFEHPTEELTDIEVRSERHAERSTAVGAGRSAES